MHRRYSYSELFVNTVFHATLAVPRPSGMVADGGMPRNRIKSLRKERHLTSEQLAEKVGISQGHMSRIENGTRGLSLPLAERFAVVLGTDTQTILGLVDGVALRRPEPSGGMAEDAEPYTLGPDDFVVIAPRARENVDPWKVKSNALNLLGIQIGDIIMVDVSAEAVEAVRPLQPVIAQIYDDSEGPLKAMTVLRQFVPPSLLITNSSDVNAVPMNRDRDDIAIKGVVVQILHAPRG